jgi:hypothetical protein
MIDLNENFTTPAGSQILSGGTGVNTQQQNVQGQSTAPTQAQAGNTPATDPTGDQRSELEIKMDQDSAGKKFTSSPDEADDSKSIIGSRSKHRYEKVGDSVAQQLMIGLAAYGANYLSTGDVGQALQAAGGEVNEHLNVLHRQSQIQAMEDEGLAPIDIETFIKTGNKADLTTNKGKWVPIGGGWVMNQNTGEKYQAFDELAQQREKMQYEAQIKNQAPNYQKITDENGREHIVNVNDPNFTGTIGSGGDDGTHDADEAMGIHRNATGDLVVGSRGKGGAYIETPASADQRKGYEADHPNASTAPTETNDLAYQNLVDMKSSIDTLDSNQKNQLFNLANLAPDKVQNALTATSDPKVRAAYNQLQGFKAQNAAVGGAEFKRIYGTPVKTDMDMIAAEKLAPYIDFTSPEQFEDTFNRAFKTHAKQNKWDVDKFGKDVEARKASQPKQVQIPQSHVSLLLQDQSPEAIQEFNELHGKGAAEAILKQNQGG